MRRLILVLSLVSMMAVVTVPAVAQEETGQQPLPSSGGQTEQAQPLPASGGAVTLSGLLPAAALLVGSGVLAYAVLRRS